MTKPVLAIFDDIAHARQVVEDLVAADFERNSISLITNDAHNHYRRYLEEDYVPVDDAVTAVHGASFGAVVGALTGVLVGVAALMLPGIGLAIVAGPLVAGLTGAVAGALTGSVVGALVKSGVPEDEAPYYAECIRRGGTLVSLETTDTLRAEDIMHRHGSINIHERVNLWRQAGWQGFDADEVSRSNEETAKPLHVVLIPTPTATITPDPNSNAELPVLVVEPALNDDDTDQSKAVLTHQAAMAGYPMPPAPSNDAIPTSVEKE